MKDDTEVNIYIIEAIQATIKDLEEQIDKLETQIQVQNHELEIQQNELYKLGKKIGDINQISASQVLDILENITRPVHVTVECDKCDDWED